MTKSLLIVSPAFQGYNEAFRAAFDAVGYRTSVVLYDQFATLKDKAWNKLAFELPELAGKDTSRARARYLSAPALEAIKASKPDLVLIIKGDALSDEFWEYLAASRIPYVVWIYDEIRRMRFSDERLLSFSKVATYSAEDCAALEAKGVTVQHIANGFDSLTPYREIGHRNEVTFVGAAYQNRMEVMQGLHDAGERVRVYGREWSHDLRDRARTWNRPRPALPASRDISRADAYGVMKGSLANINVHYNQDGFTMRTFETPGVGGVQIIDRPDVNQHYEVGTEVLVYSSIEEILEHTARLRRDIRWANALRDRARARTLAEHTLVHRARTMKEFFEV